jgi:glycerophosphoryl diester phosphodiesterase
MTRRARAMLAALVGVLLAAACWLLAPRVAPCRQARRLVVETTELALLRIEGRDQGRTAALAPPRRIAHGGGTTRGVVASSSREALEDGYARGYRFFETDLNWTSDGELVAVHDWERSMATLFAAAPGRRTLAEFRALAMTGGLTQLALADLMAWLERCPDAFLVTDVKEDNLRALLLIAARFPTLRGRIVPQIYRFREHRPVRQAGFANVILTLYVKNYSDRAVLAFVRQRAILAVTMPVERARGELPAKLARLGCFVYAHTVNDEAVAGELAARGVAGVYTDLLAPR